MGKNVSCPVVTEVLGTVMNLLEKISFLGVI